MSKYQQESDEWLFSQLKLNDQKAFKTLYERYWDILLQGAYYKLHSQDESEELVQQIFLTIWTNRTETQLRYSFKTYISAALRYSVFALMAQKRKLEYIALDGLEKDLFIDDSTQQALSLSDLVKKLDLILGQLPEKCEMIFRMSRDEGLSNKEISERLDVSVKTVEANITRALKLIKSNINQLWLF